MASPTSNPNDGTIERKFCPFTAVTKLCYTRLPRELKQPVASVFFDSGKIYERQWKIFYIWSTRFETPKPTIFVLEEQVRALFDDINQAIYSLEISSLLNGLLQSGFTIDFSDAIDQELRPQVLGYCNSKTEYDSLVQNVPSPCASSATFSTTALEAFTLNMEIAQDIADPNKQKREAKQLERLRVRKEELLKLQILLGLATRVQEPQPVAVEGIVSQPSSDSSRNDVIFVAIDVEAYERAPHPITEIGIASLDTREIRSIAPGPNAQNWHNLIRARHIRISQYRHLVNRHFLAGCPDRFEFGRSEFVGSHDVQALLSACFERLWEESGSRPDDFRLVLVGHNVLQDVRYLQQVGIAVSRYLQVDSAVDTCDIFRAVTGETNQPSLGKILENFNLPMWNLHNAGNDAVYTLQSMLAIAVEHAEQ